MLKERIKVLKEFLIAKGFYTLEEIEGLDKRGYIYQSEFNNNCIEVYGVEYLVLTNEEANNLTWYEIIDNLWKLKFEFLAKVTGLDKNIFSNIFKTNTREVTQQAFKALIKSTCGLDELYAKCLEANGNNRGAFLSYANGREEVQGDYCIYKVN